MTKKHLAKQLVNVMGLFVLTAGTASAGEYQLRVVGHFKTMEYLEPVCYITNNLEEQIGCYDNACYDLNGDYICFKDESIVPREATIRVVVTAQVQGKVLDSGEISGPDRVLITAVDRLDVKARELGQTKIDMITDLEDDGFTLFETAPRVYGSYNLYDNPYVVLNDNQPIVSDGGDSSFLDVGWAANETQEDDANYVYMYSYKLADDNFPEKIFVDDGFELNLPKPASLCGIETASEEAPWWLCGAVQNDGAVSHYGDEINISRYIYVNTKHGYPIDITENTDGFSKQLPRPTWKLYSPPKIALSATVADGAKIDFGTEVGAGSTIATKVRLRNGAIVGSNSSLGLGAKVGRNATVGNQVVMGKRAKIRAKVIVEDHATLGKKAKVLRRATIGAHAIIGAKAIIDKRAIIATAASSATAVIIGAGAYVCKGVTIGESVVIGAGATVSEDVLSGEVPAVEGSNPDGSLCAL